MVSRFTPKKNDFFRANGKGVERSEIGKREGEKGGKRLFKKSTALIQPQKKKKSSNPLFTRYFNSIFKKKGISLFESLSLSLALPYPPSPLNPKLKSFFFWQKRNKHKPKAIQR